jgi:hypothetical protein
MDRIVKKKKYMIPTVGIVAAFLEDDLPVRRNLKERTLCH